MENKMNELHSDLQPLIESKGGMFDVSDPEMEKNIGRKIMWAQPTCGAEREVHKVIGLQKDFRGRICYRCTNTEREDYFGRPADPDKIFFIDDDKEFFIPNYVFDEIADRAFTIFDKIWDANKSKREEAEEFAGYCRIAYAHRNTAEELMKDVIDAGKTVRKFSDSHTRKSWNAMKPIRTFLSLPKSERIKLGSKEK